MQVTVREETGQVAKDCRMGVRAIVDPKMVESFSGKCPCYLGFCLWTAGRKVFHSVDSRGLDGTGGPADTRRSDTTKASRLPRHDLMTGFAFDDNNMAGS